MNSLQLFGVLLFSAGILVFVLYGFYVFILADMPPIIKLPMLLIVAGIIIVLASLIAERFSEIRGIGIKKEVKK